MAIIDDFVRPFQEEDIPWFLSHPKSLNLYEPRLGKTVVNTKVLLRDPLTSTVLIACSKNAMATWIDHIKTYYAHFKPDQPIDFRIVRSVNNDKTKRYQQWSNPQKPGHITFWLVTWQAWLIDWDYIRTANLNWDTIIGDEIHKRLRNAKTKTSQMVKGYVRRARRVHMLSGTMSSKWGPGDYFNVLSMLDPKKFTSYWNYMHAWCHMVQGHFGWEILGLKNQKGWHLMMQQYARFRDRATYAPYMPTVQRDRIKVDPTPEQRRIFDGLEKDQFAIMSNGSLVIAANSLENYTRKRQLLTCPKILDPSMGYGAAMDDILEKLADAKEDEDADGQHIVIFTTIRKALDHFEAALRGAGYSNVWQLVGGTEPEDLERITEAFTATKGIILCTTQFAQAFSLSSSRVCYHIGWAFDPNDNKQAEDRLVGQVGTHTIMSYYYVINDTNDEDYSTRVVLRNELISVTNRDPRAHKPDDWIDPMYLDEVEEEVKNTLRTSDFP